jgi:hypothetical protein
MHKQHEHSHMPGDGTTLYVRSMAANKGEVGKQWAYISSCGVVALLARVLLLCTPYACKAAAARLCLPRQGNA